MNFRNTFAGLAGVAACALSLNAVAAATQVEISAQIYNVYDPGGVLADLNIGTTISGSYSYDDSVADFDSNPAIGAYQQPTGVGKMSITLGSTVLSSDASSNLDIFISDEAWAPTEEVYGVYFWQPSGISNTQLHHVSIDMLGNTGSAFNGDQLAGVVPDLALFDMHKTVYIAGERFGQYFHIEAKLTHLQEGNIQSSTQFSYKAIAQLDWVSADIGGKAKPGDHVTIHYTLDTTTPDLELSPELGFYKHNSVSGALKIELPDGSFIEAGANAPLEARVENMSWGDMVGLFSGNMISSDPLLTGAVAHVDFWGSDTVLNSDRLPAENMQLTDWMDSYFHMHHPINGWHFSGKIISLEAVTEEEVLVVPGDAPIHPMQKFDAAFHIENTAPVMNISGTLNGMVIDEYFNGCEIYPGSSTSQVVICRSTHYLLMPGENRINVQFQLMDESVIDAKVIWTLQ